MRAFQPTDWDAVLALEARCFPPEQRFTRADYEEELRAGAWCLVDGDPAVGAVWVQGTEIVSLAVLPEHRNKGVGRRLLRAALERLKDAPEVTLDVGVLNAPALLLYRSEGFCYGEEKADFYGPGKPAHGMIRYKQA